MKQEFIRCHEFLANRSIRLVAQCFDRHILVHPGIQAYHKSLRPPHAFPEGHGWEALLEYLLPNDHRTGRGKLYTQLRQNAPESLVALSFQEATLAAHSPGKPVELTLAPSMEAPAVALATSQWPALL